MPFSVVKDLDFGFVAVEPVSKGKGEANMQELGHFGNLDFVYLVVEVVVVSCLFIHIPFTFYAIHIPLNSSVSDFL